MNQPLISVIVAIYNVEEYLPKCIESILNQTYKNIELILVIDGSPDNSLNICNQYAEKDGRIKVIEKENGGQATARNKALDIAMGDYIGFIDGDDWIEPEMYQTLYEVASNESADVVQCGWYKVDPDGRKVCPYPNEYKKVLSSDEALESLIDFPEFPLNTSVCSKLFKSEVAQHFRFSPVRAYEDDEYIFKTVSYANKIVCLNTPLYDYLNRENSTMTAKFNMNKIALVTIQKNICDYLRMRYPKGLPKVLKVLCSKQFYILSCLLANPQLDGASAMAKKIESDILSSYDEYVQNPAMGINKIMLRLMKYTPKCIWSWVLKMKFA